jgi:hypothetical protein
MPPVSGSVSVKNISLTLYKKMPMNTNGQIFFSAAEFYGHSRQIILKRLVTLGQIYAGKFFYRPILKGSRQMLWYRTTRVGNFASHSG